MAIPERWTPPLLPLTGKDAPQFGVQPLEVLSDQ
jgi:hypothetical protein